MTELNDTVVELWERSLKNLELHLTLSFWDIRVAMVGNLALEGDSVRPQRRRLEDCRRVHGNPILAGPQLVGEGAFGSVL